ncbi:MAG: hypothetical protein JRM73_03785 [Nitrososphaerota archaeon]|nr:hypothetical protein [Nitrososphaerota archaeon]
MRPQLFGGGIIVVLIGAVFYLFAVPLAYFWGIPFVVGGAIMVGVSFFLSEGPAPIAPPEGYKFCIFCSTPVALEAERCPHCNGSQPRLN